MSWSSALGEHRFLRSEFIDRARRNAAAVWSNTAMLLRRPVRSELIAHARRNAEAVWSSAAKMLQRPRWSLRVSQWAEACLWTVGCAAIGYCGYILADAWIAQVNANRALDRSLHSVETHTMPTRPVLPTGAVVGRVEVPRLAMSAAIFESFDASVLNRGVGHLRGSAMPGETGNVVLAAHRDTFFRPLRNIRKGDEVTLATADGEKRYRVESTRVVEPDEISVMNPTSDAELTLITCYPFNFFGHAPERFIVRARAMDAPPPSPALISASVARTPAARTPIAQPPVAQPVTAQTAVRHPAPPTSVAPAAKAHPVVARARKPRSAGSASIVVPTVVEDYTPAPVPEAPLPFVQRPETPKTAAATPKATAYAPLSAPAPESIPSALGKHKHSWNPIHLLRKIPHPKR